MSCTPVDGNTSRSLEMASTVLRAAALPALLGDEDDIVGPATQIFSLPARICFSGRGSSWRSPPVLRINFALFKAAVDWSLGHRDRLQDRQLRPDHNITR